MRSAFFRQMLIIGIAILLTILSLAGAFQFTMTSYLEQEKKTALTNHAQAIAALGKAYVTLGGLQTSWDFRMSMTLASEVAGEEALVCSGNGTVLVCSCKEFFCEHLGKRLPAGFMYDIRETGEYYGAATLEGIYDEQRYIKTSPLVSDDGRIMGIVLVSAPVTGITNYMHGMFRVFFLTAIAALIVSMLVALLLSRNEVKPVLRLTDAVRRFGRGEMQTRVDAREMGTREMTELATSFNSMADQLEKTERRRQEFVANISHELKTPMTNIGGYVDGMLDGVIPPEEHRRYMEIVSREVRRLDRLVRSMLDISRMQSEGLPEDKKQRFDLSELVLQTFANFEQKISQKEIECSLDLPDDPAWTVAGKDAIAQVIFNLADNAVKFCPQGGELTVSLKKEGGKYLVTVQNSGPTIPAEELPLIFDRFHKTDKSRSKKDGVGLGLYIVKTIIGVHGEDIRVESRNGITAFTFTLPCVK